jgi:hypothetical protein
MQNWREMWKVGTDFGRHLEDLRVNGKILLDWMLNRIRRYTMNLFGLEKVQAGGGGGWF